MEWNQIFCKHIYKQTQQENLEGNIIHVHMIDNSIKYRVVGVTEKCIKCNKNNYRKTKIFDIV